LGISSPLLTRKNHVQQQNPGIGYPFQAALTFVSEVDRKRPGVFDIDFMEGPLKVFAFKGCALQGSDGSKPSDPLARWLHGPLKQP
jgi:hypothetical protein